MASLGRVTNNSWIFPPTSISDDWLILVDPLRFAVLMIRTPYTNSRRLTSARTLKKLTMGVPETKGGPRRRVRPQVQDRGAASPIEAVSTI
jgi:hypothetical protein